MKKLLSTFLIVCLCISMTACNNPASATAAIEGIDIKSTFNGILSSSMNDANNNTGGVERLLYSSPIQNDFLFIESRLVDYVGEDKFKEWTHAEAEKGTYEFTVNVIGYIKHFNIAKEQFTKACNVIPDLPLYTAEQINALYGTDIETVLKYIKNAGAVYSNGKLYSAEWMNCSSVNDYLSENIDITEIKAALQDTKFVIEAFSNTQNRSSLSYDNKINEYESLIN
ncbi:MAG: hypothetical protein RR064_02180 [Oscillospiraceae bacterium]